MPLKPTITQVLPLEHNQTLAHYHLQWEAPANADRTSIDHYILSIGSKDIFSVHSTQTDAVVAINANNAERELRVYAVDRCNQTGSFDQYILSGSKSGGLSSRTISESTSAVIYTNLAATFVVLLISLVTCGLVIWALIKIQLNHMIVSYLFLNYYYQVTYLVYIIL